MSKFLVPWPALRRRQPARKPSGLLEEALLTDIFLCSRIVNLVIGVAMIAGGITQFFFSQSTM
jgi:hypothetical protein